MDKFVRNLITEWRRLDLPFAGETIIVAVSGGADSVSLLLAVHDLKERKKLDHRFVAAHFNHQLRGRESDADEVFVKELTTRLGMELVTERGHVAHEGNLEQNARIARYDFFNKTADKVKAFGLLTAHTMNDQAETFLMNLVRGSGVDGLTGMPVMRELRSDAGMGRRGDGEMGKRGDEETRGRGDAEIAGAEFQDSSLPASPSLPVSASALSEPFLPFTKAPLLIRPLLKWAKRGDTENFCRERSVEYRYDTMNEDMAFKRVRIRKILIPMLLDLNPKIIETLANTSDLLRLADPHPEKSAFSAESELTVKYLKTLEQAELYNKLRGWLKAKRGNLRSLELKHIEAIERLVKSTKSGKIVELPHGESIIKESGRLIFTNIKVDK